MFMRLMFAALLLSALPAAGQPPASPETPQAPVTVSMPDTAAPPEWELRVPLSVKVATGVDVGRMALRVTFPSPTLEYTGFKATEQLEYVGFGVTVEKPVIKDNIGSLNLELRPAKPDAKALRSGVAVILIFKVSPDAEETSFPMKAEDMKAWGPAPGRAEIKAASEREASFVVAPPGLPIFACFFYMH